MSYKNKKTIDDLTDLASKRVLVRCDFNVPMQDGEITDTNRIVSALPTIKKLIAERAKVILCSHFGKPKDVDPKFSLAPVAIKLSEFLGQDVIFSDDDEVVGKQTKELVKKMNDGEVVLLQNTRFRKEETKNGEKFSKQLASLADVYVNDAFGSAHRAHCSTAGVAEFVKETAIGYLMEKELEFLGNAIDEPVRPLVAVLGGAKVSDKIDVINNLLDKVDKLLIGGGMAYTFMKAKGYEVGKSLLEEDKIEHAKAMAKKAKDKNVELFLPIDVVVVKEFRNDTPYKTVSSIQIEKDWMGVDIGEETRRMFVGALAGAKTVIWNGPMGVFEFDNFARGTFAIARALSEIKGKTIIGGGDSAAAISKLGFADKMSHISTGGGASLEFLGGKDLPGVSAIQDRDEVKAQ